jgi:hypothetical protein
VPLGGDANSPITWRSVLLGLFGVVLICGLTPYNDYALNNTYLVGNNLPLGVVLILFVIAIAVNGPLSKFAPRHALSSGELAVAMSMALVSCALPSSGLMRYFPPTLVVPFDQMNFKPDFAALFEQLRLPRWLWPTFDGDSPRQWMTDPIVAGYVRKWDPDDGPPPFAAWVTPALTWGVFLAALYGAVLCLCVIMRRQWVENERLPFPLAQIQLALIEQPAPRRFFNSILSRRSFWFAFAAVFLLHFWRGLARVWPQYFPEIPVYWNFHALMTEPPWVHIDPKVKDGAIFFAIVGVTYFVSSPVAFSLFVFFLLMSVYKVIKGTYWGTNETLEINDQTYGAAVVFTIAILWVARRHWMLVIAQAFRGAKPDEPRDHYLPYPVAFWALIACVVVMVGWLRIAGATLGGAVTLVALLLTGYLVIARVIAETGLVHGALRMSVVRPWQMLVTAGFAKPVPVETFYLGALLQSSHYDYREPVSVYATHGMKVMDEADLARREEASGWRRRWIGPAFIGLLIVSLVVGYFVSFASTLWTEYRFGWTQDVKHVVPINDWGARDNVALQTVDATVNYDRGAYHPPYDPAVHFGVGAAIGAALSFLRLRFAWWPLHPIGYLILGTYPSAHLWPSIALGWLAKTLIVRFGGASFYLACRPFFIGLIVGESIAAGFWLLVGIVLSSLNIPYSPVNIMPG